MLGALLPFSSRAIEAGCADLLGVLPGSVVQHAQAFDL
jgi:hypothetical protein